MNVPLAGVMSSGIWVGVEIGGVAGIHRSGLNSKASVPQVAVLRWSAAAFM